MQGEAEHSLVFSSGVQHAVDPLDMDDTAMVVAIVGVDFEPSAFTLREMDSLRP